MEPKIGEVNNGLIPVKIAQMFDHVISVAEANKIAPGAWKDWYIQTLLYMNNANDKNKNDQTLTSKNKNIISKDNVNESEWQKYNMNVSEMEYTQVPDDENLSTFGFYIRVPFYFIEYQIDLKFRLLNNKLNKRELKTFKSQSSQIFNVKIPSFLIEPKFEVGQPIVYNVPNAHFVWSGKIVDIIENTNDSTERKSQIQRKDSLIGNGGLDDNNDGIDKTIKSISGSDDNNNNGKEGKQNPKNDKNNTDNKNSGSNDKVACASESESKKKDDDYLGSSVRYLIEINENYAGIDYNDKKNYIFTVDHRQIYPSKVSLNYTINIIDRKEIECDFILCNNNSQIRQYYWDLRNIISNYYQTILKEYIEHEKEEYWRLIYRYDFDLIGALFSNIVCQYLFDLDNNGNGNGNKNTLDYKIRCFTNSGFDSDDGMLFNANHWGYTIGRRIGAIDKGIKINSNPQGFDTTGWNCDMCRCSIHVNDWCFHCQKYEHHDYCINCTYSMANEIIKFEHYLQDIIHTTIDSQFTMDCIQVLVAFVCGYAKKSC